MSVAAWPPSSLAAAATTSGGGSSLRPAALRRQPVSHTSRRAALLHRRPTYRHQIPLAVAATPSDRGAFNWSNGKDSSQNSSSSSRGGSVPGSGSSTPGGGRPSRSYTPRPLQDAASARAVLQQLQALLPQPPHSTPLTPLLALLLPLSQHHLSRWHPDVLLSVLRLCRWAGVSPTSDWVQAWLAAVQQQLPALSSETACGIITAVLQLRQHQQQQEQLAPGLMDDFFVGVLRSVETCSSSSIAAAMAAVAAVELAGGGSTGGSNFLQSGGSSATASSGGSNSDSDSDPAAAAPDSAGGVDTVATAASIAAALAAAPPAAAAAAGEQLQPGAAASQGSEQQSERPSSFGGLVQSSSSSSSTSSSGSRSQQQSAVGPLSSWEDLAAAAADFKPDAAAATAAQKNAFAAEAAAAGAAAAAAAGAPPAAGVGSSSSSSVLQGLLKTKGSNGKATPANITLAGWLAGHASSSGGAGSCMQQLGSGSQLLPIALHCLVVELGKPGRLQQLTPPELALVAAAVATLQLTVPEGWLDSYFAALDQQLPRMSGPALVLLTSCLPLLLPTGGNLRLWQQLGVTVQQQGLQLQAEQLCELLPLVLAADLALPTDWIQQVLTKIQVSLSSLSLPQSSRALVSAVGLGCSPGRPWLDAYMTGFRAQLSELNPEGLVDVLRALSTANALPSYDWLKDMETDVQRRFGFIGPVELSSTAFLFANLGHVPSDAWKGRFLAEALRFRAYYSGPDLSQVVWSAVRLGATPDSAWLDGYVEQLQAQLGSQQLQAYQLAFTFAALQKLGATMPAAFIDRVLDAYAALLPDAAPSDTSLVLVTVARLRHVSSYSWLQRVLDVVQQHMLRYDGQELVTLVWSLAQLHHQPCPEWLDLLFEASEPQLPSLSGKQLTELIFSMSQLQVTPPAAWMDAFLSRSQSRLLSDGGISGRDAAAILASLAALNHTPTEPWLHACLNLIHWRIRELDGEGMASVATSLAKLKVFIANGPWLDNYVSMTLPRLSAMTPQTLANLLAALAVFGATPSRGWVAAFQLLCVQQAEAGAMTADQLEQVVVALASLKQAPSDALLQLYYDASLPLLPSLVPSSVATVLTSLQAAEVQPDAAWLKAVIEAVRANLRGFTVTQLNAVEQALGAFQARGMRFNFLSDFLAFLREFFLN